MSNWDNIKCTTCNSHNICRKKSVSKASSFCKSQRGIIPSVDIRHSNKSFNFVDVVTGFVTHISPKQLFKIRKAQEDKRMKKLEDRILELENNASEC